MGMKERGGRMQTEVIPDIRMPTLQAAVKANVEKGSIVSTDELASYGLLTDDGFAHGTVQHGQDEYVFYDEQTGITHHVNSVENFWNLFKASVRSTHIHVSAKHMQRYLREFSFRSNHREHGNLMFDLVVSAL